MFWNQGRHEFSLLLYVPSARIYERVPSHLAWNPKAICLRTMQQIMIGVESFFSRNENVCERKVKKETSPTEDAMNNLNFRKEHWKMAL